MKLESAYLFTVNKGTQFILQPLGKLRKRVGSDTEIVLRSTPITDFGVTVIKLRHLTQKENSQLIS